MVSSLTILKTNLDNRFEKNNKTRLQLFPLSQESSRIFFSKFFRAKEPENPGGLRIWTTTKAILKGDQSPSKDLQSERATRACRCESDAPERNALLIMGTIISGARESESVREWWGREESSLSAEIALWYVGGGEEMFYCWVGAPTLVWPQLLSFNCWVSWTNNEYRQIHYVIKNTTQKLYQKLPQNFCFISWYRVINCCVRVYKLC